MTWEPMTIDEYAAFKASTGAKVQKVKDIWWTEASPFFYRPLFPFTRLHPQVTKYPTPSVLGGVLHLVPSDVTGNSSVIFFHHDEIKEYAVDRLGSKQRSMVKKGTEVFSSRRITDAAEFAKDAAHLGATFLRTTSCSKESPEPETLSKWVLPLLKHPKIQLSGAYSMGKLHGFTVTFQVEGVILCDPFVSDPGSEELKVTDFLVHTLRESAKSSDAALICLGINDGRTILHNSAVTRGCKVSKLAAYTRVSSVASSMESIINNCQRLVYRSTGKKGARKR